jgi:hypothetical protein
MARILRASNAFQNQPSNQRITVFLIATGFNHLIQIPERSCREANGNRVFTRHRKEALTDPVLYNKRSRLLYDSGHKRARPKPGGFFGFVARSRLGGYPPF